MQWFGESWGAPVCSRGRRVSTPVGSRCEKCALRIREDDRGLIMPVIDLDESGPPQLVVYHLDCFLLQVLPQ